MPSGALQIEPMARSTSEVPGPKIAFASVSGWGWARAALERRKEVVRKVSFIAMSYGLRRRFSAEEGEDGRTVIEALCYTTPELILDLPWGTALFCIQIPSIASL